MHRSRKSKLRVKPVGQRLTNGQQSVETRTLCCGNMSYAKLDNVTAFDRLSKWSTMTASNTESRADILTRWWVVRLAGSLHFHKPFCLTLGAVAAPCHISNWRHAPVFCGWWGPIVKFHQNNVQECTTALRIFIHNSKTSLKGKWNYVVNCNESDIKETAHTTGHPDWESWTCLLQCSLSTQWLTIQTKTPYRLFFINTINP